ncbi:hypothetical protein [Streptacidiphilus anmyonensis]|uniref:hypothetical protein n=1 Tax=Streptacidiphilus anmyonensis TaxID=405782 RepID=UPI0005A95D4F|nr:hypothetical protein [Streptacidiphilus anmyonensis]
MDTDTISAADSVATGIALDYDAGCMKRTRAFMGLVDRAVDSYGIALNYASDENESDALREAMAAALGRVSRGFAAAALDAVSRDSALALTAEQQLRLDALIVALDLPTAETLSCG